MLSSVNGGKESTGAFRGHHSKAMCRHPPKSEAARASRNVLSCDPGAHTLPPARGVGGILRRGDRGAIEPTIQGDAGNRDNERHGDLKVTEGQNTEHRTARPFPTCAIGHTRLTGHSARTPHARLHTQTRAHHTVRVLHGRSTHSRAPRTVYTAAIQMA